MGPVGIGIGIGIAIASVVGLLKNRVPISIPIPMCFGCGYAVPRSFARFVDYGLKPSTTASMCSPCLSSFILTKPAWDRPASISS